MITGEATYFNARSLLATAQRATELTVGEDALLVGICFSVISVEAFVNQLPEQLRFVPLGDKRYTEFDNIMTIFSELSEIDDRINLQTKLNLICIAIGYRKLSWGQAPLQDLKVLIKLRNRIVHAKAEKFTYKEEVVEYKGSDENLLKFLELRNLIKNSPRVRGSFFSVLNHPNDIPYKIAKWAVSTARETIKLLIDALPDSETKALLEI